MTDMTITYTTNKIITKLTKSQNHITIIFQLAEMRSNICKINNNNEYFQIEMGLAWTDPA